MVIKLLRTIFLLVQNKFSNQIAVFIGYDVLIGYFSSMGTKLVFMKELKHQFHLGKGTCIYISSSVISRMCLLLEDMNKLEKVQRTDNTRKKHGFYTNFFFWWLADQSKIRIMYNNCWLSNQTTPKRMMSRGYWNVVSHVLPTMIPYGTTMCNMKMLDLLCNTVNIKTYFYDKLLADSTLQYYKK